MLRLDEIDAMPKRTKVGFHHMGTTRMTNGPEMDVVDARSKVPVVHNLYVARRSTFATSGAVSPMPTLISWVLRLATVLHISAHDKISSTRHR